MLTRTFKLLNGGIICLEFTWSALSFQSNVYFEIKKIDSQINVPLTIVHENRSLQAWTQIKQSNTDFLPRGEYQINVQFPVRGDYGIKLIKKCGEEGTPIYFLNI
jgi:hypothetical protein